MQIKTLKEVTKQMRKTIVIKIEKVHNKSNNNMYVCVKQIFYLCKVP